MRDRHAIDPMPPKPGMAAIANDGEQPCPRVTVAVAIEVSEGSEDGVLNDILRIVLVAKEIVRKRVRVIEMREHESLEGLDVTLRHQGPVRVRKTMLLYLLDYRGCEFIPGGFR